MEKLYTVNKNKTRSSDCGSDHELLIAKFRPKLKKVGKTTRPFRYDLQVVVFKNVFVTNYKKFLSEPQSAPGLVLLTV